MNSLIGIRMAAARKTKSLTQWEMAEKLGMGRANYSHMENGRVEPTSETLQKIAEVLNVSTDYLLGMTDDSLPKNVETPSSIKAWLRTGNPDLTEKEKDELAEEIEDYFQMRKKRILKERENSSRE